ncbi:hypothetical protein DSM104443_02792 [Usitatibacter rugosus]|uniref:Methyltransferase type 11 domain-containing protein n=1 Tax=Usitatibacter rugosus TaxID=2732067 RepID=A0A6M4GWN9_9PROT|nr:methyltransferase domain-containing protein [Usitatibacter rugosus]QJR11710.1 hypothetical protein DSM104443_02792 [Usitatibacter rugosus]
MDLSSELARRILVCPDTKQSLRYQDGEFVTDDGQIRYPIVDGIPILLSRTLPSNFWVGDYARDQASGKISLEEMPEVSEVENDPRPIKAVRDLQSATSGYMYAHLESGLNEYPIPSIRLPPGNGKLLVDIGSNWGRWVVAAARSGYTVVGVDIHLHGLRAARRVCAQLGVDALLICGDARRLPLKDMTADTVFSYSVLQHFSREDFAMALTEIARILRSDGSVLVQMPNRLGVRNFYNRLRNRFREEGFNVRYYFPSELVRHGHRDFSRARTTIDGFFGLGIQPSDWEFFTPFGKMVCLASEGLRRVFHNVPGGVWLADSLYLHLELPRGHSANPQISTPRA